MMTMKKFIPLLLILSQCYLHPGSARAQSEKPVVLLCDPLLNIRSITNRSGIVTLVNNASSAGFEAIALGVKTVTGEVIYNSKIAPRLVEWKSFRVPMDFDPVQVLINEANRRNIKVYALFSVFAEGHVEERQGLLYSKYPEWASMVYVIEEDEPQVIPFTEWGFGTIAYANPLLDKVQNYEISVVREFLQKYSVAGILFDKARFYGIEADFSKESKRKFQVYLGNQTVNWWPADVLEWKNLDDDWQIVRGEYFQDWVAFRSAEMRKFMDKMVKAVRSAKSSLPIGNLVGAWYPEYYENGVNWASEQHYPDYDWATDDYNDTATAELFDHLVVGAFFPRVTVEDAEAAGAKWWMSVEGSASTAMEVVNRVKPVFGAVLAQQFKDDANKFKAALTTILDKTDGLYVGDYSVINKYKYWDEIRTALSGQEAGVGRRSH